MVLHFSNPQLSASALHNFQGTNARSGCQTIAQPSPNLSLTSLHLIICSPFLSCLPICLRFLCWKDFYFCQLLSFFSLLSLLVFLHKTYYMTVFSPSRCCPFCSPSHLRSPCRAWTPWGRRCGCHQHDAGRQGVSCPYQRQVWIATSSTQARESLCLQELMCPALLGTEPKVCLNLVLFTFCLGTRSHAAPRHVGAVASPGEIQWCRTYQRRGAAGKRLGGGCSRQLPTPLWEPT